MPRGFFHHVKIIHITRGKKLEEITLLGWESLALEVGGGVCLLNHTTKMGINRFSNMSRVANKWQGYVPHYYCFNWSHVWASARSGKEFAFMWYVWHKAVAINKW